MKSIVLVDLVKLSFWLGIVWIDVGWDWYRFVVDVRVDWFEYHVRDCVCVVVRVIGFDGKLFCFAEIVFVAIDEVLFVFVFNESWKLLDVMMGEWLSLS